MHAKTIAIDLAKNVFEVAVADERGRIEKRRRLSRGQLARFLGTHPPAQVVMEACGSGHHWARVAVRHGHKVGLLPMQYVRPYRRRNKTDRADVNAILEAARAPDISPVAVKTPDQQALQGLHRVRAQWMRTRQARINLMRGLLRELGIVMPQGARAALSRIPELVEDAEVEIPASMRAMLFEVLDEVRGLEQRIAELERELKRHAGNESDASHLMQVPGVGLLTATAMVAAVPDPSLFRSARHFASWLGLTPRESSSGQRRRLGRISKRGNTYLRTLLIHGARAVLNRAKQVARLDRQPLNQLQRWVLALDARNGHNRAAVALANRLARIIWAVWHHRRPFQVDWSPAPLTC